MRSIYKGKMSSSCKYLKTGKLSKYNNMWNKAICLSFYRLFPVNYGKYQY